MIKIAVVNYKGGVGKTTTSVNLAYAMKEQGYRVLVVDLDQQAHSSTWYGVESQPPKFRDSLFNCLIHADGTLAELVQSSDFGVDVIPSGEAMATFDLAANEPRFVNRAAILRDAVAELPEEWDFCFLDCPGMLGTLTINALTAADAFLIPVFPGEVNLKGIPALVDIVMQVRQQFNPTLWFVGALVLQMEGRTNVSKDTWSLLDDQFGPDLFKAFIRKNVQLSAAYSARKPIQVFSSASPGSKDFRAVGKELQGKLESYVQSIREEAAEGRAVNG